MMSDFWYEIKRNFVTWYLTEILTENPGWSVRNEHNKLILILVDPVDDEDWRDRPGTDPPVSDFGTGLGSSSSNELISARLSYQDSFASALILSFSSINWSRLFLVQVRISCPVSVSVSVSVSVQILNLKLKN